MKRMLAIILGVLTPASTAAAGVRLSTYFDCTGLLRCGSSGTALYLIDNLIAGVGYFIVPLATVIFFYGALRMLLSRGEEGKEVGKKALIYGSFGLAAALLVGAVIAFVRDYLFLIGS